jgi:hypothetical protein
MGGKHKKSHLTPSADLDFPSVGDCFTGSLSSSAAAAPAAGINEGSTVTYTVNLTSAAPAGGLAIPYTLSGTGITTGDFTPALGALTGTINILAGSTIGTLPLTAANDLSTGEGAETLTVTLGAAAGVNLGTATASTVIADTSVAGGFNPIPLAIGTTAPVAATNGNDLVTFDVAAAKASAATTQINVTGFSTANDSWTIDLPVANPAITTLAQLNGQQGVTAFANGITGNTDVTFGTNAAGNAVAVSLVGVTDLTTVKVLVI